ncbi:deoxyribodipyrimidine photo-lyase [Blastomonas natatoria]|uniref:Deoxyribodipyrimidine photo-lyase n=1 Tax=Blastomonas natatoria TaxID=34015 RepID=A0A2V3UNT8_9SPHN|nr:deoxyribodipyrimidine photo-lyase [Blastomonas natatoria]PXW68155.1 deoxyribodipyrimidine photo-lyase [Blastomonas natatoria]
MTRPVIVWLRRDLRLADQAAFAAAAKAGPVVPVYVLDDETPKHRKMGGASRWWLHHSLASLAADLEKLGSRLILRRGVAADVIADLAKQIGAAAVHVLRHYEPWWRNAERALKERLPEGCALECHHGNYLMPPGSVTTGSGQPYKIYTPFWRALAQHMPPPEPVSAPEKLAAPESWPESDTLGDWALLPTRPDWAKGFAEEWMPGEKGAAERLEAFLSRAPHYEECRNLPSVEGTSRLSPHLHFGEISPATIWHATMEAGGSVETFLKELVWRDYAQNVILQYPDYAKANARDGFDKFPWRDPADKDVAADIRAWQQGRTGYPLVDAGMRQLWATGWMHNRVRMVTASFLIKHLLVDWREGEKWFWDTLVDADYGSNATNWQWTSGTGVDSNMFVRIMAPLTQSEKFDAAAYIRQWVPELAGLSDKAIHDPEAAGKYVKGYPKKLIGHKEARERALAAHAKIKS